MLTRDSMRVRRAEAGARSAHADTRALAAKRVLRAVLVHLAQFSTVARATHASKLFIANAISAARQPRRVRVAHQDDSAIERRKTFSTRARAVGGVASATAGTFAHAVVWTRWAEDKQRNCEQQRRHLGFAKSSKQDAFWADVADRHFPPSLTLCRRRCPLAPHTMLSRRSRQRQTCSPSPI